MVTKGYWQRHLHGTAIACEQPPVDTSPTLGAVSAHDPERWLAELRAGSDANARRRQRWIEDQGAEASTMRGLLHDLAEAEATVAIDTASSGHHRGLVRGVGVDVVVVAPADRAGLLLLAIGDLIAVRTDRTVGAPTDRGPTFDATLQELLVDQLAERNELTLITSNGDRFRGVIRSVGQDLLALRRSVDEPPVHIATAAVTAVRL